MTEIWLYQWASGGLDHFYHKPTAGEHLHADDFVQFAPVFNTRTPVQHPTYGELIATHNAALIESARHRHNPDD